MQLLRGYYYIIFILLILLIIVVAIVVAIIVLLQKPSLTCEFVTDPEELRRARGFAAYFEGFTPCDRAARRCGPDARAGTRAQAQAQACADAYLAHLLDPATDAAAARAVRILVGGRAVADAHAALLRRLPEEEKAEAASAPWRVALLADGAEGGFPHTHGDVVCLPASFVIKRSSSSREALVRTLAHERVHVLQRRGDVASLLPSRAEREASVAVASFPSTSDVALRRRSNPDLDGRLYVSRDTGLGYGQFFDGPAEAERGGLGASRARWFDASTGDVTEDDGGSPSKPPPEHEHPHEREAYFLEG